MKSWDDVKRTRYNSNPITLIRLLKPLKMLSIFSAPQGRKLPNFAPVERIMRLRRDPSPKKKYLLALPC